MNNSHVVVKGKRNQSANRPGIAIVGNMNVGKTALFTHMCGGKSTSMNISGNTVSIDAGKIRGVDRTAFDTPGIFSIFSNNEDARASRDLLLPGTTEQEIRGLLFVADAKNMKRSIAAFFPYAEYGIPMVFDINMFDEAASFGVEINTQNLSEILGIDICTTVARDGIGVTKLVSCLSNMRPPNRLIYYPDWIEQFFELVERLLKPEAISARAIGLLLLSGDGNIENFIEKEYGAGMLEQLKTLTERHRKEDSEACSILFSNLYNRKADQIADEVQTIEPPAENPFIVRFGDWCAQFSTGIPIAIILLYLMYLFVGAFGATFLVDAINGTLFEDFLIPLTEKLVAPIPVPFIRDMIVDPDFGILPTGVFLALGLVLPVLFCFYIAFGILEDSGYLPRLSILLDKVFHKMGLNGKSVIPLVMGFSCVTMAILTTRMLDTKKEKNIATFLLLLGMPCAPLLAVMFIILGKMPLSASIAVFGIIFTQIIIAGFFANKILPGERSPLFMEIPPMRIPKALQILKMSATKTYFFMKEAVPVFIFASFLVFLFERMGGLAVLERILEPVISDFMGLPEKSVQVFIKTIIRRESGATEIEHLSSIYSNLQLVVNLLVMTFLLPCMNATIVLFKERGTKTAVFILGSVMVYAIVIGSLVNHTCKLLGITFV